MSRLGTRSEIEKLAATLALPADELAFLSAISPDELRSLRVSIYDRLFAQDAPLFERLAALALRLPARAAAHLAERTFGPLISARVAAELPGRDAAAIAARVSLAFFADTAAHLDPRRTRDLIERIPPERIGELARELVQRREYMTISRFIEFVSDEQTRAAIDAIEDEADLLRVTFYMGSKNRMDHLFRTLAPERIERMVARVQQDPDTLLPAFLAVLIHVSYELKRRFADIVAAQPADVLTGYIRATQDGGLWGDVLPVVATMSPASQHAVVNLPILAERDVQESIIATADATGQWSLLLPLLREMGDENRDAVAAILASMGPDAFERAIDGALLGERWDVLIDLAARMPGPSQAQLTAIIEETIGPHDRELLERIRQRISESRTGPSASSAYS